MSNDGGMTYISFGFQWFIRFIRIIFHTRQCTSITSAVDALPSLLLSDYSADDRNVVFQRHFSSSRGPVQPGYERTIISLKTARPFSRHVGHTFIAAHKGQLEKVTALSFVRQYYCSSGEIVNVDAANGTKRTRTFTKRNPRENQHVLAKFQ